MYFEDFRLGFSNWKVNPSILGILKLLNLSFVSWKSSSKTKKRCFIKFSNFEKWWFYLYYMLIIVAELMKETFFIRLQYYWWTCLEKRNGYVFIMIRQKKNVFWFHNILASERWLWTPFTKKVLVQLQYSITEVLMQRWLLKAKAEQ